MRKAIVALLALSPMMLNAQANSPAKTQSSAAAQVLESKLNAPKGFAASNNAAPTSTPVRISTGVTAPKIISTVGVAEVAHATFATPRSETLVISLVVDAKGKPADLKVVKSAGTAIDSSVLAAVSQYRFAPGTLNNEPIAIPMNLEVTVQHIGR